MKNVLISVVASVITTIAVIFIMHSMNPECHGHEGCSKSKTECSKEGKKCAKGAKCHKEGEEKTCKPGCTKACCAKSADAKGCKPGCTKACCAAKVADSTSTEGEIEVTEEVEEVIEE